MWGRKVTLATALEQERRARITKPWRYLREDLCNLISVPGKNFEIPTMYSRAKPPKHVHPKRILNRIPPPKKI